MEEPDFYSSEILNDFFTELRLTTEKDKKVSRWKRAWNVSNGWFSGLFIVKLWVASTARIIQSIESSDPLSLGGTNGSQDSGHKAKQRLQQLIKTNQRLKLRRLVANWAIFFVIVQLACSNVFFWLFLSKNNYSVEPQVMIAWLSACVVEVIGILVVIARSLFPKRDRGNSDQKTTNT